MRSALASVALLLAALSPGAIARADEARARENYLLHCMGCHGEAGDGFEQQVPSMRGTFARLAATSKGRAYVLGVPGVTQSSLDAALVAEILNWALREFNAPGTTRNIKPFTATDVVAARAGPLLEVSATRKQALAASQGYRR